MRFSELPSDLDDQLQTLGPPPSWFPVTGVITTSINPTSLRWYSTQFQGTDPRVGIVTTTLDPYNQFSEAEEVEVNPIEILTEIQQNQEMPNTIPLIANRYTNIDPTSPMFRSNRPKYGYGEYGELTSADKFLFAKLLVGAVAIYYFLLRKK